MALLFKQTKTIDVDFEKREQAYKKFFRDDPKLKGRSYRLRDNYIWHTDEAYEAIDYYLKKGIEP